MFTQEVEPEYTGFLATLADKEVDNKNPPVTSSLTQGGESDKKMMGNTIIGTFFNKNGVKKNEVVSPPKQAQKPEKYFLTNEHFDPDRTLKEKLKGEKVEAQRIDVTGSL
jgi:hypothetical protein